MAGVYISKRLCLGRLLALLEFILMIVTFDNLDLIEYIRHTKNHVNRILKSSRNIFISKKIDFYPVLQCF